MGKKGKRHDKLIRNSNTSETVSILTPTVSSRQHFLHILAECIINQTFFSKIQQWVIVSADKSWSQNQLDLTVQSILNKYPILKTISMPFISHIHWLFKTNGNFAILLQQLITNNLRLTTRILATWEILLIIWLLQNT